MSFLRPPTGASHGTVADAPAAGPDTSSMRAGGSAPGRSLALRAGALSLAFLAMAGCIGRRGNVELLEARLRQHEDLLNASQRTLAETRSELSLARREADLLRQQMANAGDSPLPPEYTAALFQIKDIRFNTLMTGGRDRDSVTGDELLVVVFAPYDEHGDLVKLPGRIELEALDLNRTEEEGRRIARWTFTPDESRELWRSSLFTAGFELKLVWPEPPEGGEILLHARLTTADGRRFDASHTISINPTGGHSPPGAFPAPDVIRAVNHEQQGLPPGSSDDVRHSPATPTAFEELSLMPDRQELRPLRPRPRPRPEQEPAPGTAVGESTLRPLDDAVGDPVSAGGGGEAGSETEVPRPFPEGLRTSDVWTDETIPRLR